MAVKANKKFWTEFINIYHSQPSLWNTKDKNYKSRESRSLAWNKLVEKLREIEPGANLHLVRRKINTFRSNFNRELQKIRQTQKEQTSKAYKPMLWYFDNLSFLLNQEKYNISIDEHSDEEITLTGLTPTKCDTFKGNGTMLVKTNKQIETTNYDQNSLYDKSVTSNAINTEITKDNSQETAMETETLMEYVPVKVLNSETTPMCNEFVIKSYNPASVKNQTHNIEKNIRSERIINRKIPHSSFNKRTKLHLRSQDSYNRSHSENTLSSIISDEAAIYGQSWACAFRKLSPQQKLFAKKAIDEILILGQLNVLELQTVPMKFIGNGE